MDQDQLRRRARALRSARTSSRPIPRCLYNQGRALEAMGEYPRPSTSSRRSSATRPPRCARRCPACTTSSPTSAVAHRNACHHDERARRSGPLRDKNAGTIQKELKLRTRAGSASLEVSAEGYVTFKKDLDLTAGSTVKVDAQLSPKKTDAIILVRSRPSADISARRKGPRPIAARVPRRAPARTRSSHRRTVTRRRRCR